MLHGATSTQSQIPNKQGSCRIVCSGICVHHNIAFFIFVPAYVQQQGYSTLITLVHWCVHIAAMPCSSQQPSSKPSVFWCCRRFPRQSQSPIAGKSCLLTCRWQCGSASNPASHRAPSNLFTASTGTCRGCSIIWALPMGHGNG